MRNLDSLPSGSEVTFVRKCREMCVIWLLAWRMCVYIEMAQKGTGQHALFFGVCIPQWQVKFHANCHNPSDFNATEYGHRGGQKERTKEMFSLTTHWTHFNYCYIGAGHMVEDHSDSERRNPLPPPWLLFFRLAAKELLYAPFHRQNSKHHGLW